jgi:hypothetical protein
MQINGIRKVSGELVKSWLAHATNMYKQRGIDLSEDEFWDLSANITTMLRAYIVNPEMMMQSAEISLHPEKYPFPELTPIENNEN